MRLARTIIRRLLLAPTRVCAVDDQRSWKAFQIYIGALHVARAIDRSTTAERIGVMLPTSGLFPMSMLATWILGRTLVPLNYLLSKQDRAYIIDDAGIDTIVTVGPMVKHVASLPEHVKQIRLDEMRFSGVPPMRRSQSRPDDAEPLLIRAHKVCRDTGNQLAVAHILVNLAQCYFDSKRYGAARRTAEAASRIGASLGARQIPILCAIVLGELDEVADKQRAAVTRWREALDAAKQLGNKKLRFQLEFVLFRRALRDGDNAVARSLQRRMRRLMHGVPADTPEIHDFEVLVKSNQHLFDKRVAETQPVPGAASNSQ